MLKISRLPILALIAVAVSFAGCASAPRSLNPNELSADQGAFFGNVTVFNNGQNVTRGCYLVFTDSNEDRKAFISMDDTGWVFAAADPGTTFLSNINCKIQGSGLPYNSYYETRQLKFEVRKGKDFAYFGHVEVELNSDGSGVAAATLLAGSIGNAIAANAAAGNERFRITNRIEDAVAVYNAHYQQGTNKLVPFASLAGTATTAPKGRVPASNTK